MKTIKNIIFTEEKPKEIKDTIYEDCNFKENNFYKAKIENCTFINCNFAEANLSKAQLKNCKFIDCYMQFSAMLKVNIYNCEFIRCDLWHSNLCHSIIKETKFEKTILRALFKELDWENNEYDKETIIKSCGGSKCKMNIQIIEELINTSKRSIYKVS